MQQATATRICTVSEWLRLGLCNYSANTSAILGISSVEQMC